MVNTSRIRGSEVRTAGRNLGLAKAYAVEAAKVAGAGEEEVDDFAGGLEACRLAISLVAFYNEPVLRRQVGAGVEGAVLPLGQRGSWA